jgi:rod shape-determining protein MreD
VGDTQPRRLEEILAREAGTILLLTGLALLQVTLLIVPFGFSMPLILVLVLCRTLIGVGSAFPDSGVSVGMRWAFYGGLALDLCGATPLGSHALALLISAALATLATRRTRIEGPLIPLLVVFFGAISYELVLGALTQPWPIAWRSYLQVVVLPAVLMALIPSLPIFFGLRWLLRRQL